MLSGYYFVQNNGKAQVLDVQSTQNYVVHQAELTHGSFSVGDDVRLTIDGARRASCMSNHTATHIINFALGRVLGGVRQQGSMVGESKLTFDFTCDKV